jgi:hypothetical protein
MAHTLKQRVDSVITDRGCDPHYMSDDGTCVYRLSDESQGSGPYISTWSPPDDSYGDEPTLAELEAVSEAECDAANESSKEHIASMRIDAVNDAVIAAVAAATSVDADALRADVVNRLKDNA